MSYIHDLARERLLSLQARYLSLVPDGALSASRAVPLMSRDQIVTAIVREAERQANG